MYSINVLEQGTRLAIALSTGFKFFQWEKSGVIEGWREKGS